MKLIIDIPDVTYKRLKDGRGFTKDDANILYWKSRYGTPLDELEEEYDVKNLRIKLENAEDIIRGLKSDLADAREELQNRW